VPLRVLVVDDKPLATAESLAAHALRVSGHELATAHDGQAAFEALALVPG